ECVMPLAQSYCIKRRNALINQVQADLIVVSNPQHILYFSGYWVTPLHLGSWGTPHLLIDASTGFTTLLTHNFAPDTSTAVVDEVRTWNWYNGKNHVTPLFPQIVAELSQLLRGRGHVAIESGWLPHGMKSEQATDITGVILNMRRRKDED